MKASFEDRAQGFEPARPQAGIQGFNPFESFLIFQYVLTLKNQHNHDKRIQD
jgi:hypothetical protein